MVIGLKLFWLLAIPKIVVLFSLSRVWKIDVVERLKHLLGGGVMIPLAVDILFIEQHFLGSMGFCNSGSGVTF